jgi:hypothetical protein
MPNGKKGDHPLTDLLHYGESTLPEDIQQLVRDIVAADEWAFKTDEALNEQMLEWDPVSTGWFYWERGERLDEARAYLRRLLDLSRVIRDERDPVADGVSAELVAAFPSLEGLRHEGTLTYPLDFANTALAGVRVNFDSFLIYGDIIRERLIIDTYPMPCVTWNGGVIYRFAPGDSKKLVSFLRKLETGDYVIVEAVSGMFSRGSAVVYPRDSVPRLGFARVVKHRLKFP